MSDENQVAEELYAFARALVGKIVHRRRGDHWKEDAVQDLVLAGLKDYRDTGDIGLAKNRMVSRQKNLLRDDMLERKHEPKPESAFAPPVAKRKDDEDEPRGILEAGSRRDDPVETALVKDILGHLPERRRRVVELRMAGYLTQEVADALGVSGIRGQSLNSE